MSDGFIDKADVDAIIARSKDRDYMPTLRDFKTLIEYIEQIDDEWENYDSPIENYG